MKQHWLLSAASREFSRKSVEDLDDEGVIRLLCKLRWGSETEQVCPECGTIAKHYWRKERRRWRCRSKGCAREFSVTSGTAFHAHKLPLREILRAIFSFTINVKGIAACTLSRDLGCTWKTAWLLAQKLREAIIKSSHYAPVTGVAQMDGAYFGGKRRAANKHGTQRDDAAVAAKIEDPRSMRNKRRLQVTAADKANRRRRLKRRVVLVLRELDPQKGRGARRTLVYIAKSENEVDATTFARQFVEPGTVVMTDEGGAFTTLSGWCEHRTVIHSREYVAEDGTNDNQAESFFSRMRRAEYGVYHGFRPMYLIDYASEAAWREDNRRKSTGENFERLVTMALKNGHSRWFSGYFQGNRRKTEILGPADASICYT